MNSTNKKLIKISREIKNKYNEEIEDIILFGSYLKGKEFPNDVDVLLIFKKKVDKKIETELKKALNIKNIELNSVTKKEFENEDFIAREGIYLEGFSLIKDKKII